MVRLNFGGLIIKVENPVVISAGQKQKKGFYGLLTSIF
jgi:hypothetical protein